MKLKRYLVFGGDYYYPLGGWEDFIDSFDTLDEVRERKFEKFNDTCDWVHAVDTITQETHVILRSRFGKEI